MPHESSWTSTKRRGWKRPPFWTLQSWKTSGDIGSNYLPLHLPQAIDGAGPHWTEGALHDLTKGNAVNDFAPQTISGTKKDPWVSPTPRGPEPRLLDYTFLLLFSCEEWENRQRR